MKTYFMFNNFFPNRALYEIMRKDTVEPGRLRMKIWRMRISRWVPKATNAQSRSMLLKPIWTYGIPLWGTASQSNIEILQRLQNKILRMVTNAPWYVPNHVLHSDLQIPTIREEITRLSTNYKATIDVHPNKFTTNLFEKHGQGRLRRLDLK